MEEDVLSEPQSQSRNDWILWVISALILASLGAMFLYSRAQKIREKANVSAPERVVMNEATQAPANTNAKMVLRAQGGSNFFTQGETVTLDLVASSEGVEVIGYDAVIEFDSEKLQYLSTEGRFDGYKLYSRLDDGRVSLSGVVDDGPNMLETSTTMDNTVLVELRFKILPSSETGGQINLPLMFMKGETNDTNLLNKNSQDILGSALGEVVFVGRRITLTEGAAPINVFGAAVTAEQVKPLEELCADCTANATIKISPEEDNQAEKVKVELGGIMGKAFETYSADGYIFTVESIESVGGKGTVVIIIAPDRQL